jgi:hypothetical protein
MGEEWQVVLKTTEQRYPELEKPHRGYRGWVLSDVHSAAQVAERFVAPLGRRWQHVQAVADRAHELSGAVTGNERDGLVAAAWLHDIGYSDEIGLTRVVTGSIPAYTRTRSAPLGSSSIPPR